MNEVIQDLYVFEEAEKAEKAVEAMRRAIGKKNETVAAVKFAHTMLDLSSERRAVKDENIESRRALLNTYCKILAVKNWIHDALDFAIALAGRVYDEYKAQGGDHYEAQAYFNGTTRQEEIDKKISKPTLSRISTPTK